MPSAFRSVQVRVALVGCQADVVSAVAAVSLPYALTIEHHASLKQLTACSQPARLHGLVLDVDAVPGDLFDLVCAPDAFRALPRIMLLASRPLPPAVEGRLPENIVLIVDRRNGLGFPLALALRRFLDPLRPLESSA